VSDGCGGWRLCSYVAGGVLEPVGSVCFVARLLPAVTVAFAVVKGDRPEWTVQKLVEVGVDRIVPMTTGRSVVRWTPEKAVREVERLRAVARGAAMQSRQVWLPEVAAVAAFASVLGGAALGPSMGAVVGAALGAALAQAGGGPPSLACPTILVGPEGGWDDLELALDLPRVGLGPTVLRSETAAVAAGVFLCGMRAGVVRPGG